MVVGVPRKHRQHYLATAAFRLTVAFLQVKEDQVVRLEKGDIACWNRFKTTKAAALEAKHPHWRAKFVGTVKELLKSKSKQT